MATKLTTIGLDADDTLWQNEKFFRQTQDQFSQLLADFIDRDTLAERLLAAEKRNLGGYGFGIKGFVLSMIEVAIEASDGKVPANTIKQLINAGQEMLGHPVELLPHARAAIEGLGDSYRILLITKGDLLDQQRKLALSGLDGLFDRVEVIPHKTAAAYREIFGRLGDGADAAMMVGNSMRSDVIPALQAGGWGVYVPHALTWELEHEKTPHDHGRFFEISDLGQLGDLVASL